MKTKINKISLPKKVKAMRPSEMVCIPADQVQKVLPTINALKFPIHREYQQGNLIIERRA